MNGMAYIVEVGFYDFNFNNAEEAMAFAQMARTAICENDSKNRVTITLVNSTEEEENKED